MDQLYVAMMQTTDHTWGNWECKFHLLVWCSTSRREESVKTYNIYDHGDRILPVGECIYGSFGRPALLPFSPK